MALFSVPDISLKGITVALPANIENNGDLAILNERERNDIIQKVGIGSRRVAINNICTSDLCIIAAKQLLIRSGISAASIGIVVFVTQTPDYPLPGNSLLVQKKLNLSSSALLLDLNQGCAGYLYGMSVITSIMHTARIDHGILLVGDTITRLLSPNDRSTRPIFSDAGSATLFQRTNNSTPIYFNLGADSGGFSAIHIKDGGSRHPFDSKSLIMEENLPGISRAPVHLIMEGIDVFNYSLKNVVPNIKELLGYANSDIQAIDYFIFHQANRILNETLIKKLGITREKAPETLSVFGNTSSATIPVTLSYRLGNILANDTKKIVLSGFGVGFSWGSALLDIQSMINSQIIEITSPDAN